MFFTQAQPARYVPRGNGWVFRVKAESSGRAPPESGVSITDLLKSRDGRAEKRIGVVPEFGDAWMPFQRRLYDAALDAAPPAVDQAHFGDAGFRGRVYVVRDDAGNVPGRECVKVQLGLDRDVER